MKLSRKEKNSYWMPYTDNEWFKKKQQERKGTKDEGIDMDFHF